MIPELILGDQFVKRIWNNGRGVRRYDNEEVTAIIWIITVIVLFVSKPYKQTE